MIGQALERSLSGRGRTLVDLAAARPMSRAHTMVDMGALEIYTRRWSISSARRWATHRHTEHELIWDVSGTVAVEAEGRLWVVPPTMGLWLPAGVEHEVAVTSGAAFACTFLATGPAVSMAAEPTLVSVHALAAEAMRQLEECADRPGLVRLLSEVVTSFITIDDGAPLPMPRDPRAHTVATALLNDPADARSLPAWARYARTSVRTLSRQFVEETGLSFAAWRAHLRTQIAIALLAGGSSVSEVSHRVGYQTPSAFSAAFRRAVGQPPGRFAHLDRSG